jgi:hypothetical protein
VADDLNAERIKHAVADEIAEVWREFGDTPPTGKRRYLTGQRVAERLRAPAPAPTATLDPTDVLWLREARRRWLAGERIGDAYAVLLIQTLDRLTGTRNCPCVPHPGVGGLVEWDYWYFCPEHGEKPRAGAFD